MRSPAIGLDSRSPLEMMGTRVEAQAVIDLIGRLENGGTSEGALHDAAESLSCSAKVIRQQPDAFRGKAWSL